MELLTHLVVKLQTWVWLQVNGLDIVWGGLTWGLTAPEYVEKHGFTGPCQEMIRGLDPKFGVPDYVQKPGFRVMDYMASRPGLIS